MPVGNDPATDLRDCGMLGLFQLCYLHFHSPANAHAIYDLSISRAHGFPLATVSMNATKWAMQALREGRLNREANRRQTVTEVQP